MKLDSAVLYEDNHLIAVNKPPGLLVQGDKTGDTTLLDYTKEYLRVKYNKPGQAYIGLVHRLDRPVSGVVLMAKTSKALARMNAQFQHREVKKSYWAITAQSPPKESDTLTHWLKKDAKKNKTKAFRKEAGGAKRSELNYELKMAIHGKYLLEVTPTTGRAHQIRAQLSAVGCPLIGDLKYGFKGPKMDMIGLHSRGLEFIHPVRKEPISIKAPLPEEGLWQPFL